MYKSMISTMINTKRARSAIGDSRASQRERNRSDKKKEKPEKRNANVIVATCHEEPLTPYI